MSEPISHRLKRQKIQRQMRNALAGQELVLDDGSGQQVGIAQQGGLFTRGGEVSTQKGQKEEQLKALAKRKKALDAIKGTRKALEQGKFLGEKEKQSKDKDDEVSGISELTTTDDESELLTDESTDNLPLDNMTDMKKLTDNPFAQAGAALIGVLEAEEKRKDANRKLEADAMVAKGKGKSRMAAIHAELASKMKGMLS